MRTFLCLTFLATVLHAQESFDDADFTFTFAPPEGMVPLTEPELRNFLKVPPEIPLNTPLADDQSTDLVHRYYWRDTAEKNREISLLIGYSPKGLPWVRPEDYAESMAKDAQLTIVTRKPLRPPHPGFVLEGTATRPDGILVRRLIAYFTLGRNEYAIMALSTLDSRWGAAGEGLAAALDSVRFPLPEGGGGGGKGSGAKPAGRQAPQGSQAAPSSAGPAEKWSSLEVTGSLVLAVVLIMGLFTGGKRPS